MRIIAGEFRHRVLLSNPGDVTRPITDRVKESLFARLEHELPGKRVADVFSGTGTIGNTHLSFAALSTLRSAENSTLMTERSSRLRDWIFSMPSRPAMRSSMTCVTLFSMTGAAAPR